MNLKPRTLTEGLRATLPKILHLMHLMGPNGGPISHLILPRGVMEDPCQSCLMIVLSITSMSFRSWSSGKNFHRKVPSWNDIMCLNCLHINTHTGKKSVFSNMCPDLCRAKAPNAQGQKVIVCLSILYN